jgi:hypothetical protein
MRAIANPQALLDEARIRASKLLKQLRSEDREASFGAARRIEKWLGAREEIRRKHALDVVASEFGYQNWLHLKRSATARKSFDTDILFQRNATFLNLWFKTYEEARAVLDPPTRYLFPHRQHFVVCEEGMLRALGIDIQDEDWERIGRDWVQPVDPEAWNRLATKLKARLRRAEN